MTDAIVKMNWDEFAKEFLPVKNHLNPAAEFSGHMFETFGEELQYVRALQDVCPDKVWTYMSEDDTTWITHGYHHVNRMGYFVTEKPGIPAIQYSIDEYTFESEEA